MSTDSRSYDYLDLSNSLDQPNEKRQFVQGIFGLLVLIETGVTRVLFSDIETSKGTTVSVHRCLYAFCVARFALRLPTKAPAEWFYKEIIS
jgi:hypothetical protein